MKDGGVGEQDGEDICQGKGSVRVWHRWVAWEGGGKSMGKEHIECMF